MLTSITPGSGVTLKLQQPRIAAGRRIALDEDRLAEFLGGVLDRGDEVEIVLGALDRRHEDVQVAVARLEGNGACARSPPADEPTPGRGPRSGASARFQASRRAVLVACAVGRRSCARFLAAQHRRAAEGVERRQVGMGDHRIGLGDEAGVRRRRPRQQNRAAGGSPAPNRRGSGSSFSERRNHGPLFQRPRPFDKLAHDRQHGADRALEPLLEDARQPLALQRVLHLGSGRPRRCSAARRSRHR